MLLDEMAASVHTLLSLLLVLGGCTLCNGRITNQEIGEWKNTLLLLEFEKSSYSRRTRRHAFDVFHFYAAKNFESLVSNMNLIIRRKSYFLNRRDSPIEHLFGLKTIFIDSCNSVNLNELI